MGRVATVVKGQKDDPDVTFNALVNDYVSKTDTVKQIVVGEVEFQTGYIIDEAEREFKAVELEDDASLSGTPKIAIINIDDVPYYFKVYPVKSPT